MELKIAQPAVTGHILAQLTTPLELPELQLLIN
jgi:hypothetical protein